MYKKTDYLLLPYSTSAVYHNLTIRPKQSGVEEAAVIHHDTVCIVSTKSDSSQKARFIKCLSCTNEKYVQITQVILLVDYTMVEESIRLPKVKFVVRGEAEYRNYSR